MKGREQLNIPKEGRVPYKISNNKQIKEIKKNDRNKKCVERIK